MKRFNRKNIRRRKENLDRRVARKNFEDQAAPMFGGGCVEYSMSGRAQGMSHGGIGAIHAMVLRLGLPEALNGAVKLLQAHTPYYESDHILNLAYNVLVGGERLEDLEDLRADESYMDGLGAERIPDPTTAGDFLRRFDETAIVNYQEAVNAVRGRVWAERAGRDAHFYDEGVIDVDGTIAETLGGCKGGMDLSYKGIWGYAPLVVTLANTREPLYIINRPGNTPSCAGAAVWIDRAIELVGAKFQKVTVRGDTDFSLTEHLDKWDERARFVLGYDAHANLQAEAESLGKRAWKRLRRPAKHTARTAERARPANVKDEVVREREFKTLRLRHEHVAEFPYRPGKCQKTYRIVVVRKNISIEKGEQSFLPEIRYFFYITNDWETPKEKIVFEANARCDQENIIAQLKSGINALRAPVDNLHSNWAYMAIASLAWTLKSWYGLLMPDAEVGREVVRMEYKKFLRNFIALPCEIIHTGRRLIYRIIGYTRYLEPFFDTWDFIRRFRPT